MTGDQLILLSAAMGIIVIAAAAIAAVVSSEGGGRNAYEFNAETPEYYDHEAARLHALSASYSTHKPRHCRATSSGSASPPKCKSYRKLLPRIACADAANAQKSCGSCGTSMRLPRADEGPKWRMPSECLWMRSRN